MPGQRRENQKMVTAWLDRALVEQVQARAEEREETVADVIRRALKRYVR